MNHSHTADTLGAFAATESRPRVTFELYHPMKKSLFALTLSAALAALTAPAHAGLLDSATQAWEYKHSGSGSFLSEIVSFDASRNELWVSGVSGIDILNAQTGSLVQRLDTSAFGNLNSVSIRNGVAAIALENKTNRELPGLVQTYSTASRSLTGSYTVGALPDMLTFTPDGSKILVANEGTPNNTSMSGVTSANSHYGALTSPSGSFPRSYGSNALDPVGSVSIIHLGTGSVTTTSNLATATREGSHIRTNTGMDFEPEYIAVNAAGTKAYVTLQEANAIGVLDLASGSFEKVVGLGAKDYSQPGNRIDPKNDSTATVSNINLVSVNAKGLYQPDAVATYQVGGQTLLVMANEGDFREDDQDRSTAASVNPALSGTLLSNLRVLNTDSSVANGLFTAGARSFSIRDANGTLVYDSGEILDREAIAAGIYDDGRSRDKGVEPEGVELMEIDGRTLAFIGLERTTKAAVAAFDITDPNNVSFLKLLVGQGTARAPEGLKGYRIGKDFYLSLASEGNSDVPGSENFTTTFHLATTAVPEPGTYALGLAGLAVALGAQRRRRQGR